MACEGPNMQPRASVTATKEARCIQGTQAPLLVPCCAITCLEAVICPSPSLPVQDVGLESELY